MILKKTLLNLKIRGIHHDVEPVPKPGLLETLTRVTVVGNLMVSLTHMPVTPSGTGGDRECLVAALTIGEEFLCVLVPKTLKEKVLMVLATTGQLAMKI